MRLTFLYALAAGVIVTVLLPNHVAESGEPADPRALVPPLRYVPVTRGTKSYRPVEPKPWGAVNARVTPKDPRTLKPVSPGDRK